MRCSEIGVCLPPAGIAPSVGSQGDAYDHALAESVIGLYKTEVIRRKGPWRTLEAVEFATLTWVDSFNTRRLLGPLGTSQQPSSRRSTMPRPQWPDSTNSVSDDPGTVQCLTADIPRSNIRQRFATTYCDYLSGILIYESFRRPTRVDSL